MQTDDEAAQHSAAGHSIRHADAAALARALQQGRELLLTMFRGFETQPQSRGLAIAYDPVLNLPLWELGHIGWFEEWWISRNAGRAEGMAMPAVAAAVPASSRASWQQVRILMPASRNPAPGSATR